MPGTLNSPQAEEIEVFVRNQRAFSPDVPLDPRPWWHMEEATFLASLGRAKSALLRKHNSQLPVLPRGGLPGESVILSPWKPALSSFVHLLLYVLGTGEQHQGSCFRKVSLKMPEQGHQQHP